LELVGIFRCFDCESEVLLVSGGVVVLFDPEIADLDTTIGDSAFEAMGIFVVCS
jgi:hypothetical protein